jgi:hypothetical protein
LFGAALNLGAAVFTEKAGLLHPAALFSAAPPAPLPAPEAQLSALAQDAQAGAAAGVSGAAGFDGLFAREEFLSFT